MNYYNCERRHSRLGSQSPREYFISEEFIPKALAENGAKSGSATAAQAREELEALLTAGE